MKEAASSSWNSKGLALFSASIARPTARQRSRWSSWRKESPLTSLELKALTPSKKSKVAKSAAATRVLKGGNNGSQSFRRAKSAGLSLQGTHVSTTMLMPCKQLAFRANAHEAAWADLYTTMPVLHVLLAKTSAHTVLRPSPCVSASAAM